MTRVHVYQKFIRESNAYQYCCVELHVPVEANMPCRVFVQTAMQSNATAQGEKGLLGAFAAEESKRVILWLGNSGMCACMCMCVCVCAYVCVCVCVRLFCCLFVFFFFFLENILRSVSSPDPTCTDISKTVRITESADIAQALFAAICAEEINSGGVKVKIVQTDTYTHTHTHIRTVFVSVLFVTVSHISCKLPLPTMQRH